MGTKQNPGNFDCYGKAADDEPIFTLRAKDPSAPNVIRWWVALNATLQSKEKIEEALRCADAMEEWKKQECKWCHCVGYHSEICEGFNVNDPAR